ncbi:MAG TPA: hypothetical protein VFB50_22835 [Chloroflexota bacterium]|nr:hypothetical protein [Chloroflexota bacterium]
MSVRVNVTITIDYADEDPDEVMQRVAKLCAELERISEADGVHYTMTSSDTRTN